MLLHRTGLLDLDYDMEYDTLSFAWPVLKGVEADEIEHSFNLLIDSIKHYDIKRLLIDSSSSTADLSAGDFHDLVITLSKHFLDTRLEKIARIASHDPIKESQTEKVSGELSVTSNTRITYRNFSDLGSAVLWLRE